MIHIMNVNDDVDSQLKTNNDIIVLIQKKMLFFQDIIQKTILYVQKNKILDILGVSDVSNCVNALFELSKKLKMNLENYDKNNSETLINDLQNINNELSTLFKSFGTESFEDLLSICFGNNSAYTYANSENDHFKFELLKKYFHPTGYKIVSKNDNDKGVKNIFEDKLNEKSKNLDCIDISLTVKSFHLKVYGLQLIIHNGAIFVELAIN